MLIRSAPSRVSHDAPSEITPPTVYERRRALLKALAAGAASPVLTGGVARTAWAQAAPVDAGTVLRGQISNVAGARTSEKPTPFDAVTSYNNFVEFGDGKAEPAQRAGALKLRPWTVTVEGLVARPQRLDIDDLLKLAPMQERIYRLRCVEGWSMVIPWVGYSLAALLQRVQPLGSAKYVAFISQADRQAMPGLRQTYLQWPYTEGLRLDEAMHPLTLLAFGLYGRVLPGQNGAPLRLVVPWKYGFKSAKSIVAIRLLEQPPLTSWARAAPQEYGFYANVNPDVPHPRWSQATERRIGDEGALGGLLARRRPTLPFNGYAEQVASLYAGMDLRRHF